MPGPAAAGTATLHTRIWIFALAVLVTLLNAFKPLTMDDSAYYEFASQAAQTPADPYSFILYYFDASPLPGYICFIPPVFLYWWALAIKLFGDNPFLWKLWLFPFLLLLTGSLHGLFRRFARGLETPLTAMTVFSPVILPGINIMLDVPCLALGFTSLACFFRAIEAACALDPEGHQKGSFGLIPLGWAALAGLVVGLSIETKYSGFLFLAMLGLATAVFWRPVLGIVTLLMAAVVFGAIEGAIAAKYGETLLLASLGVRDALFGHAFTKIKLLWALICIVGSVGAPAVLLGATALGARWGVVLACVAALLVGVFFIAALEGGFTFVGVWQHQLFGPGVVWQAYFSLGEAVFAPGGVACLGILIVTVWRLCRLDQLSTLVQTWEHHRLDWFLVLWIALEVVGTFTLAPVPGTRRVIGLVIALTALFGRLASRTCLRPAQVATVCGVAIFGVLLGLGFHVVDWCEARVQQQGPETAAAFIRQRTPDAKIWYTGFWGFKFHAERAGMRSVRPGWPGYIEIAAGDYLVIPNSEFEQQKIDLKTAPFIQVGEFTFGEDYVPFRTVINYYLGYSPLEIRRGPRLIVTIYQFLSDFTAPPVIDPPSEPEGT